MYKIIYIAAEPTIERVQIMYVAVEPEFQESASYARGSWALC